MKKQNIYISFAIIIAATLLGFFIARHNFKAPGSTPDTSTIAVSGDKSFALSCDQSKSLVLTFHLPDDKIVDLKTSGGLAVTLENTSLDGVTSYTSADGGVVLSLTGSTLMVTEGKKVTYKNCILSTTQSPVATQ